MLVKRRFSRVRSYTLLAVSILLLFAVSTARGYTYTSLGEAGGWDDVEKRPATTYVLDRSDYTSDSDLSESQITTALTNAFDTWSSVENSSLTFAEKRDAGGNYDVFDGPLDSGGPPWFGGNEGDLLDQSGHYLYANITFGGWLDNSYFDNLPNGIVEGAGSNALAIAWTGQVIRSDRSKPRWVTEIFFNDGWTWSIDGTGIDIETVMLHELGHAIGLGHEDDPDVDTVMNPYYVEIERQLYQDDINGLHSLYPPGGPGNSDSSGKPPWVGNPGGPNGLLGSSASNVPEPATLLLLVPSLAILLGRFRKPR